MTTLSIPDLIGASVADSRCVLNETLLLRLGMLLLRLRPHDPQGICFLGGPLSQLASRKTQERPGTTPARLETLDNALGSDAFLVLAGEHGSLALLTVQADGTPDGYHVRLYSDTERVDRAALVLAQFADTSYELDIASDQEDQRGLVARLIIALLTDAELQQADLVALLPDDQHWLRLARTLATHPDPATVLTLPALQQMLRACGGSKALAGPLDASQEYISVMAATDTAAPARLSIQQGGLPAIVQSQRPGSLPATADWAGAGSEWIRGMAPVALTAVPQVRGGQVWGLLLVASERPLAVSARATLNGLGVMLLAYLSAAPQPKPQPERPAQPAPAQSSGQTPAAPSGQPVPPMDNVGQAPAAAMAATPASTPPPPATPAAMPAMAPAPARPTRQGASIKLKNMPLLPLLSHLQEGVLLVDGRGSLISFNPAAADLLDLHASTLNRALAETPAGLLVPFLTDALLGEAVEAQPFVLDDGRQATVTVLSLEGERWAIVLQPAVAAAAPAPAPAPAAAPAADDDWLPPMPGQDDAGRGDYNETLLEGFSNTIRAPLQSLRELIARVPAVGALNEQQSHLIGQVVKLNTELTLLVNDLLSLGQIRFQMAESSGPLRIDMLVEAAIGTRYAEFGRRGQQVDTEIDPDVCRVVGSEEGLGRAIGAILDNAILYSPPGAQITVRVVQQGADLVVQVRDTGPGLEQSEAAQVFEPFYRAPLAEQLGVQGRGLGLTIAKAVIEHHKGHIWVESTPGAGSMVAFSLPCGEDRV